MGYSRWYDANDHDDDTEHDNNKDDDETMLEVLYVYIKGF